MYSQNVFSTSKSKTMTHDSNPVTNGNNENKIDQCKANQKSARVTQSAESTLFSHLTPNASTFGCCFISSNNQCCSKPSLSKATCKETCYKQGLLHTDKHYDNGLQETSLYRTPQKLCHLFAIILVFCNLSDARSLWEKHFPTTFCCRPNNIPDKFN